MASILKVDTITGVATAGSISVTGEGNSTTTNLQQGLAKVWSTQSADGTSTLDSFNVTSIADTATGKQTISFANDFANANYCTNLSNTGGTTRFVGTSSEATGSVLCFSFAANNTGFEDGQIATQIKGDLA